MPTVQQYLSDLPNAPYKDTTGGSEAPQFSTFGDSGLTLEQMLGTSSPLFGGMTPLQHLGNMGVTDPMNQLDFTLPEATGSLMPSSTDIGGFLLAAAPIAGMLSGAGAGAAGAGAAGGGGFVPVEAGFGMSGPGYGMMSASQLSAGLGGAGAAGAGAGGGTSMPPAVPESAASLQAQGLTQTAPGVWEQMGFPAGPPSIPNMPTPPNMQSGQGMPPAQAPQGVTPPTMPQTPGTPAAAPGASPGPTGFDFVDKLLEQMRTNPMQALGLGMTAASLAGGLGGQKGTPPQVGQLGQLGTSAQQTAERLLAQHASGQLSAPQQAQLAQLAQNTKNQIRNYFAGIGMSDSTAARQADAAVDQQVAAMHQEMLNQALTQGLNALGIASGPLSAAAQYTLGQDRNLQQAFGQFGQAIGNLFGRSAGTTQQQQQQQPTGA